MRGVSKGKPATLKLGRVQTRLLEAQVMVETGRGKWARARMTVDTGAEHSVLGGELAQGLMRQHKGKQASKTQAQYANGATKTLHTMQTRLRVAGGKPVRVKVVLDPSSREHLLGLDALNKANIDIDG